ncbi:Ig-like domain-containing protein [Roseisolibacter sp. H3M3-2]|uniref:RCC1 domain-containing protein n=1 Tax=Roseisolibacter sp. H3M3-2 TaxID=3031323 RepID=UPI0023DBD569|nr:Ig-like domain-containing protein [Roseisolibacter sp. H3M3-2]MDF1503606.1 Ig-like domain-containing protein [Roseisolibacter sp. H3M3-2]
MTACAADGSSPVGLGTGVSVAVSEVVVLPAVDTIFARDSLRPTDVVRLRALVVSFSGGLASNVPVRWSSADTAIAVVDSTGMVAPRRLGTASIVAAAGNKTGRATVAVVWAAQRLALLSPAQAPNPDGTRPSADTLFVRNPVAATDRRALRAAAVAATGDTVTGVRFAWSSSNPAVATVDSAGLVQARAVGTTTITVRGADQAAARAVTVASVLREIRVTAPATTVLTGDTLRLAARAIGQNGQTATPSRIVWTSSNPGVATIDSTGLARVVGSGTTRFTATSDFVSGSTGGAVGGDVSALERQFLTVDAGRDHTCGVITLGRLYCWGLNDLGQLGAATTTTCFGEGSASAPCSLVPVRSTTELAFAAVSAGAALSCGVATTGRAYCWGDGALGQIGNGTSAGARTPTPVAGDVTFDSTPGAISVGGTHVCALTAGVRQVYCWGSDESGQLGAQRVGVRSTTPIPAELPVIPVAQHPIRVVSAGAASTCAVGVTGQAWCWGRNVAGELGIGSTAAVELPTPVAGTFTFVGIAAPVVAGGHACGVLLDGRAVCWGANGFGQLGAAGPSATAPVAVATTLTFRAIGVGADFTCALGNDGRIYCWGNGGFGQLGVVGSTGHRAPQPVDSPVELNAAGDIVPVQTGVSYAALTVGQRHACGLAADGSLYCWGSDLFGAIGAPLQARIQPRPLRVARPL